MNPSSEAAAIKALADACSIQAKLANRAWLGTIAVACVFLLPQETPAAGSASTASVPFLGAIAASAIYPVALAMLSILVIGMAVAHAQHIRADAMANRVIDGMERQPDRRVDGAAPRDLFDMLRAPGFTRVAPLAQWIRGPSLRLAASPTPLWRRIAATFVYLILKLVVLAVLFAIPGLALWTGFNQVDASITPRFWVGMLGIISVIAGLSLILIVCADIWTIGPRLKKFLDADAQQRLAVIPFN